MKTIQSIQVYFHSFRDDNLNEIKEQQVNNEAFVVKHDGRKLQQKPTHSTNRFKKEFYHKQAAREMKENKNIPLNLQKEIIIVFLVMILLLRGEIN